MGKRKVFGVATRATMVLLLAEVVHAQGLLQGLVAQDGPFAMLYELFKNGYVQYFFHLFGVTFLVALFTRWGLDREPLNELVSEEKHKAVLSVVIGIAAANFIFFSLRRIASPEAATMVIWGYVLTIVAWAVLAAAIWLAFWIAGKVRWGA